jgi:phosphoribosylanthranilate isomerase
MLDTAANVNRKLELISDRIWIFYISRGNRKMIIQIYEIQDPVEAESMIELGVDHIGSVLVSETNWKVSGVKDVLELIRSSSAKSSLIPLFNTRDSVLRTLDYYQPDIIHFCEALTDQKNMWDYCRQLIQLQEEVKKRFPQLMIMRSLPIAQADKKNSVPTLEFGRFFEPVSDFFLTDTLLTSTSTANDDPQPVHGFVGITGQTCNWNMAGKLVEASRIPVVLAGGISPGNVTEAIMRVRPGGVDSCTRTNALDEKGLPIRFKKDPHRVKRLVDAVRQAEKSLNV